MPEFFYTGTATEPSDDPKSPPGSAASALTSPPEYMPDEGLVHAANTALILAQPLLLTGEPGCGKTQFARSLAFELLGRRPDRPKRPYHDPIEFRAKTSSRARDVLYTYDALGRFQARQAEGAGGGSRTIDYITLGALGEGILRASDPDDLPEEVAARFRHREARRSVVLIDEIDKAPRDFPNDLLNEVERMSFEIAELGGAKIKAQAEFHPVLVITSNSEKHLPDAFLRRCIYYDIEFPVDRLELIVEKRLQSLIDTDEPYVGDAIDYFRELRNSGLTLTKPPSTAELLGWLRMLHAMADDDGHPFESPAAVTEATLSTLMKNNVDLRRARPGVAKWAESMKAKHH